MDYAVETRVSDAIWLSSVGGIWVAVVDVRVMMIRAVVGGCEMLCDGVEVFGDDEFGWSLSGWARVAGVRV